MKRKGLEAAKELIKCGVSDALRYELEKDYPELKESEDEKIRKWIIENIQETLDINGFFEGQKTIAENAITWLKKQGKQKPAWSEEDENMLKSIIATCELAEQDRDSSPARHLFEMQTNWLKSLKERMKGE